MKKELKTEGHCLFCEQKFSQQEIGKHLAKHLAEMEKADAGKQTEDFCHVEVEEGVMFLNILVKGKASMKTIEIFLRNIWLDVRRTFSHVDFPKKYEGREKDFSFGRAIGTE